MKVLLLVGILGMGSTALARTSHPMARQARIAAAPGRGTTVHLKQLVRSELSPRDGWLPSPGTLGYRQVSPSRLSRRLASKARSLGAASDGMTIYEKKIGASKVFVFDVAVDGSTFRSVLDAKGHSLQ